MSMQIEVAVNQIGPTSSQGTAREHTVTMDRPTAKGGENRGAMGGEHLLMALGGCFMSNLLAAIDSREARVSDIEMKIVGTLAIADKNQCLVVAEMVLTGREPGHRGIQFDIKTSQCIDNPDDTVKLQAQIVPDRHTKVRLDGFHRGVRASSRDLAFSEEMRRVDAVFTMSWNVYP